MKTSIAMDEIRKIRDENSLRYLSQTPEERSADFTKSIERLAAAVGKSVSEITYKTPENVVG